MTNTSANNISGWAAGLMAIAAFALVIPAIGAKATDQRSNAAWAESATKFQAFTEQDTATLETPYLRDAEAIEHLSEIRVEHRRWAENRAAEHQCLSEAIYYEARSETRSGQLAVADVVKNRVKSKHFPDTICGVVYQNADRPFACQFSFACDGSMDRAPSGQAWENSQNMAQVSLTGFVSDLTHNSTHYHTVAVNPHWADSLQFQKKVGFHVFYRPSWRERKPQSVSIAVAPPT